MAAKTTPVASASKQPAGTAKPAPKPVATKVTTKPVVEPVVKPAAKAVVKPAAVEPSPAKASKKSTKPRPALVRDSFTMPEADFALLATLKATALGARRAAKKSELLRAGLQLLAALDPKSLVAALDRLEAVKTGRPKKGH